MGAFKEHSFQLHPVHQSEAFDPLMFMSVDPVGRQADTTILQELACWSRPACASEFCLLLMFFLASPLTDTRGVSYKSINFTLVVESRANQERTVEVCLLYIIKKKTGQKMMSHVSNAPLKKRDNRNLVSPCMQHNFAQGRKNFNSLSTLSLAVSSHSLFSLFFFISIWILRV